MPLVRADQTRRTETPNAVMTTLASPTQGTSGLSLWRVEMRAGQRGPLHVFDAEQAWTVLSGRASCEVADETLEVDTGDTLVFPAEVSRRITALDDVILLVCGRGDAVVRVVGEAAPRGVPPWIR
jgi:quercetin dioxygenase-like cupin family protein